MSEHVSAKEQFDQAMWNLRKASERGSGWEKQHIKALRETRDWALAKVIVADAENRYVSSKLRKEADALDWAVDVLDSAMSVLRKQQVLARSTARKARA